MMLALTMIDDNNNGDGNGDGGGDDDDNDDNNDDNDDFEDDNDKEVYDGHVGDYLDNEEKQ